MLLVLGDFIVEQQVVARIDPAVRGLICCLIDLEREVLSLGHDMAARLIAAAQLSLVEDGRRAVNDNTGHTPKSRRVLTRGIDERQGVTG